MYHAAVFSKYPLNQVPLKISKRYSGLINIYGKGLIAAMVFNPKYKDINMKLKKLVELSIKDGLLLVYTGRESIKIGPPLTISRDAINEGCKIIDKNINLIFSNGKN